MTLPDHNTTPSVAQCCDGLACSQAGADLSPAPVRVFTVYGAPPDAPETYPAVIRWIDWNQPQYNAYAPWPPKTPPCYGGTMGVSRWTFDADKRLCVETIIADAEKFHAFVFFNWRMPPCGRSKMSGRKEPDGTHEVFGDSNK